MPRHANGGGRRLAELFFKRESDDSLYWICRCGKRRKKTSTSYQNLVSHIKDSHPNYEKLVVQDDETTQIQVDRFFQTSKASQYYGWYNFIINAFQPFSVVENESFRIQSKFIPMSLSTFMRYLPKLTKMVERKVASILPNSIALVFDGWTAGSTHYLAVYASFASSEPFGYSTRLLTISPLENEFKMTADEHIKFLSFILELYGKTWDNVVCLLGDNVSTNKAISTKQNKPMIGCASHRFNLAVKDIMSNHEDVVEKINKLMVKLKYPLQRAKLNRLTPLTPKLCNATRWSSTFEMIQRYERLREFLHDLDCIEIDDLCPTPAEDREIYSLLRLLKDLESVNNKLQGDETTMADVRALLEAVIESFPSTAGRLRSDAQIVHCREFESAVVKCQLGNNSSLDRGERRALQVFEDSRGITGTEEDDNLSFAERALKRQRLDSAVNFATYGDLRFLLPTSNICERLFSRAGHVLSNRRKAILPSNFESQLYLYLHNDLWDAEDIDKVLT